MRVDRDAIATIAVKDLQRAKRFHEGTLGLEPADSQEPGVLSYKSGRSVVLVYESRYAGTNQATAVTWDVGARVDATVHALKAKDATFEHDEMPGLTREGDVHVGDNMKAAWLKDPDGNILAIVGN